MRLMAAWLMLCVSCATAPLPLPEECADPPTLETQALCIDVKRNRQIDMMIENQRRFINALGGVALFTGLTVVFLGVIIAQANTIQDELEGDLLQ